MFYRTETLMDKWVWRWLRWLIKRFILKLIDSNIQGNWLVNWFFWLVNLEYHQGVREAGGIPRPQPLRILCYHSIADLSDSKILKNYGIPASLFQRQIEQLLKAGYHFIDGDEFLRFLQGKGGLPKQAVLLTFDDCYQDVLDFALPILKTKGIPAIAFAVTQLVGKTNAWDEMIGAPALALMDAGGLTQLAAGGIEIGSHSQTHPELNRISSDQLQAEMAGSLQDLAKWHIHPRFFAYPYGEYNEEVEKLAEEIGLQAAFTVTPGFVQPGEKHYRIPRFEILRQDTGWKFYWKVLTAGRSWKQILLAH